MTKKKATTARSARANKGATLEARAEAIIEDSNRNEIDARLKVELALSNYRFNRDGDPRLNYPAQDVATVAKYERELRDLCDRAENGDPLNADDLRELSEDAFEAARTVLGMLYARGVPDFITDALYVALFEAERATGAKLFVTTATDEATGSFSLSRVARFFHFHPGDSYRLERKHDLADHISAVMQDENTPAALYNAMQDALGTMIAHRAVENSSAVIRVALETHKSEAANAG
jgi:hypothetical protein